MSDNLKPVAWIASSRKDLKSFPDEVQMAMGFGLFEAQRGSKHLAAKPMKGFGGAGVLEIIENHDGDTFRAVYTVRFQEIIYVLHCFQKKSKSGISTPKQDVELIKARLKVAESDYAEWKKKRN